VAQHAGGAESASSVPDSDLLEEMEKFDKELISNGNDV